METQGTKHIRSGNRFYEKLRLSAYLIILILPSGLRAATAIVCNPRPLAPADTPIGESIKNQIRNHKDVLYYPNLVARCYQQNGYRLLWVAPDTVRTPATEAMLMLDCALQYGLAYDDYHPGGLLTDKLHYLRVHFGQTGNNQKSRFDILLTDALLYMINNMHYGKLNPDFPSHYLDTATTNDFNAPQLLMNALRSKEFKRTLETAQPSGAYQDLKHQLRLLIDPYQNGCYQKPKGEILKIVINMERLRWITPEKDSYIQVNIPSYSLKFFHSGVLDEFKVIVGKPSTPTPTLQSKIAYFITCPEWKVPSKMFVEELLPQAIKNIQYLEDNQYVIYDLQGNYVAPTMARLLEIQQHPESFYARQSVGCDSALGLLVFRFSNVYDIYLHDTPFRELFQQTERDLGDQCIRIEHPEQLAALILENDQSSDKVKALRQAIASYRKKQFNLRQPIPLQITYLTCEVKEGRLVNYKDIYAMDQSLGMALYHINEVLSRK
ncbi:L,D-transpeptidase family protein [Mucilaginibacter sp. HC2]|uniref:L,D-transpeptidase family protein n=1 Tax=Mucilaginibacter inviolabilis TaxID=2714892 RepID=UPI00140B3A29|nr:L,D-transpeptidase family protein [Mucilaginibacter inviolabilis]NHA03379.1 L,D-transpeptidase family protein [Mucilaginibacter inviolabilis]